MNVVMMTTKVYKTLSFWSSACSQHVTVLSELTTGPEHLFNVASSSTVVPKCAPPIPRNQKIRDQFLGDPWIHFCNGYFEVHLLF